MEDMTAIFREILKDIVTRSLPDIWFVDPDIYMTMTATLSRPNLSISNAAKLRQTGKSAVQSTFSSSNLANTIKSTLKIYAITTLPNYYTYPIIEEVKQRNIFLKLHSSVWPDGSHLPIVTRGQIVRGINELFVSMNNNCIQVILEMADFSFESYDSSKTSEYYAITLFKLYDCRLDDAKCIENLEKILNKLDHKHLRDILIVTPEISDYYNHCHTTYRRGDPKFYMSMAYSYGVWH